MPLCATLHRLIDQFNQRMQSISDKGLSIATDQAVLSMHQDLTALHMQLLQQIDETQEKKGESLIYHSSTFSSTLNEYM